jgi:hypothetical protein
MRMRWPLTAVCLLLAASALAGPPAAPASAPANLVSNGDFSALAPKTKPSDPDWPAGWTSKHPKNIKLVRLPGVSRRVIEMTGDEGLMGSYGVELYSAPIQFKPNTRYSVTGRTKSAGPSFIVFVKGYATVTHTIDGKPQTLDEEVYQMHKEIGPSADWRPFHLDFAVRPVETFSQFQHRVKYVRVELWSYWPAGTGWYDDIHFEEVGPLPDAARLPAEAVTHIGVKPHLAADDQPATQAAPAFDEQQTFADAANAFNDGRDQEALAPTAELLTHSPDNVDYHLLAARLLDRLGRYDDARTQARWLLAHAPEAWQRDWGRIVEADARWHAGDKPAARDLLRAVGASSESDSARRAAGELLQKLDGGGATTQP